MAQVTLGIIKPGFVKYADEIISYIEQHGFVVQKRSHPFKMSKETAESLYAEHFEKSFFEGLCSYMTSDESVAVLIEKGPTLELSSTYEGVYKLFRILLLGITTNGQPFGDIDKPLVTIRAKWGVDERRNVMHGSDSFESFSREIKVLYEKCSWIE